MTSNRPTKPLERQLVLGPSIRPDRPFLIGPSMRPDPSLERQLAIHSSIRPEILRVDVDPPSEQPGGETLRCLSARAQPLVSYPPSSSAVGCYTGITIDGRYRIEGLLGEGGMGVVYLGRHIAIDKKVAIKILRSEFARRAETRARFKQEARAASSMENPHVVDVSDFGTLQDGSTYLVMEYLDGCSLATLTKDEKRVPLDRAIHIVRQIAEGLAHVHDRGIIHRDLKPDNIFLVKEGDEQDFVKILDFGIAKVLQSADARVTCAGSLFGTPSYMSPEQAAGMSVDARTDVYALGIIMYELASGRVPFDADTLMGILTQHLYRKPLPLRDLVGESDQSAGLDAVIAKALSKAPEQRYQSMRDLMADLDAIIERRTPEAVVEMAIRSAIPAPIAVPELREMAAPVPATPRPKPRTPWGMYAGGAAILMACGLVMGVLVRGGTSYADSDDGRTTAAAESEHPHREAQSGERGGARAVPPEHVLFSAEPLDAHVFQSGADLGTGPFLFDVPPNGPLTIEVRRAGYKSQTIRLDGHEKRLGIKLVPDNPSRLH